jgi:hypothetical protein
METKEALKKIDQQIKIKFVCFFNIWTRGQGIPNLFNLKINNNVFYFNNVQSNVQ